MTNIDTQPPIFVVTSGRSGSTLLARLLQSHPEITVISDLFEPVGAMPYLDTEWSVSGSEFWRILNAPSHPERVRYWRRQPTDELLHLPAEDDHVSLLRCYTLPFLAGGDPTDLADELEVAVLTFPAAPVAHQLIRVFAWLRDRHGGTRWVERTGGSLPHTRSLVEAFGDTGRFIHLHRDPREVAISMTKGSFFRLYLALERCSELVDGRWEGIDDPVAMGQMVSRWERSAVAALQAIDPDRVHSIRYEDLVVTPIATLTALVEFVLERPEPDRSWAGEQAQRIVPAPERFGDLPVERRAELDRVCRPALEALGRG